MSTPTLPLKQPDWTDGRRLSREGMTPDRAHDLDVHAVIEARRKAERRESGTPSRDDMARATLHAVLAAMKDYPGSDGLEALRNYVLDLFARARFDVGEAGRVLDDMIVRADHDRLAWVHRRRLKAWKEQGCVGPRPKRTDLPRSGASKIPRRPDDTLPWTGTKPAP